MEGAKNPGERRMDGSGAWVLACVLWGVRGPGGQAYVCECECTCTCVHMCVHVCEVTAASLLLGHFSLSAPVYTMERHEFYSLLCVIENTKGSVTSSHMSSSLL